MSLTVTADLERRWIRIQGQGSLSPAEIEVSLDERRKLHEQHGFHRILGDARAITDFGDPSSLYVLYAKFPAFFRVAIVHDPEQRSLESLRMMAQVASKFGGAKFRLFTDFEAAGAWLDQG